MASTRRRSNPFRRGFTAESPWMQEFIDPKYGARGNARGKSSSGSKGQSDNGGKSKGKGR